VRRAREARPVLPGKPASRGKLVRRVRQASKGRPAALVHKAQRGSLGLLGSLDRQAPASRVRQGRRVPSVQLDPRVLKGLQDRLARKGPRDRRQVRQDRRGRSGRPGPPADPLGRLASRARKAQPGNKASRDPQALRARQVNLGPQALGSRERPGKSARRVRQVRSVRQARRERRVSDRLARRGRSAQLARRDRSVRRAPQVRRAQRGLLGQAASSRSPRNRKRSLQTGPSRFRPTSRNFWSKDGAEVVVVEAAAAGKLRQLTMHGAEVVAAGRPKALASSPSRLASRFRSRWDLAVWEVREASHLLLAARMASSDPLRPSERSSHSMEGPEAKAVLALGLLRQLRPRELLAERRSLERAAFPHRNGATRMHNPVAIRSLRTSVLGLVGPVDPAIRRPVQPGSPDMKPSRTPSEPRRPVVLAVLPEEGKPAAAAAVAVATGRTVSVVEELRAAQDRPEPDRRETSVRVLATTRAAAAAVVGAEATEALRVRVRAAVATAVRVRSMSTGSSVGLARPDRRVRLAVDLPGRKGLRASPDKSVLQVNRGSQGRPDSRAGSALPGKSGRRGRRVPPQVRKASRDKSGRRDKSVLREPRDRSPQDKACNRSHSMRTARSSFRRTSRRSLSMASAAAAAAAAVRRVKVPSHKTQRAAVVVAVRWRASSRFRLLPEQAAPSASATAETVAREEFSRSALAAMAEAATTVSSRIRLPINRRSSPAVLVALEVAAMGLLLQALLLEGQTIRSTPPVRYSLRASSPTMQV